ncbi:hypothetical protein PS906_05314 [Pseudomonas fluorescens]|nr:hypothetical protein PS906_05314 [Pseudomonas fluorescens]
MHINFSPPVTEYFEDTKQLPVEIDRQILGGYRLFPAHYLAYAMWDQADSALQIPAAKSLFPAAELATAQPEWQRRLEACPAEQRPYLIQQYATPVRNQYQVKAD